MAGSQERQQSERKIDRGMYLRSLSIRGFRSCYDTTIDFRSVLTLIVGENNAGKSNVIDALRLATSPLSRRRTRYFEREDKSWGVEYPTVDLSLAFAGLTELQRGQYITALDLETETVTYGVRYTPEGIGERRAQPTQSAGKLKGPDAEPEKRDQITHVYLAPLRDAQRELQSSNGKRLEYVMELLTTPDERKKFADAARSSLEALEAQTAVIKTAGGIQGHMTSLTAPVRGQNVGIGFDKDEIAFITRNLRMRLAEHGVEPSDLAESGLGYANLLFIATVILELQAAKDAELTLFLVEEPEAHLHPQLQAVLLDFLRDEALASVRDDTKGPAGRIQVIATTHSPNLASSVGVENVVALRTVPITVTSPIDGRKVARSATRGLSLGALDLAPDEFRKINQYLDATRAALLFAQRVILVEGVAEAVLLPVFARHRVLKDRSDALRAFRGVTLINVGSVDFAPYVKLLLSSVGDVRLLDRLVVITDGDPDLDGLGELPDSCKRRDDLLALAATLVSTDALIVTQSTYTLEADLLLPPGNAPVLEEAYLAQHKNSKKKWDRFTTSAASPAEGFYRELRADSKLISKGEFAHDIALRVVDEETVFTVPDYLAQAIHASIEVQETGKSDDQAD